mmetsp:Transcript_51897/g.121417  ORF Transcript_51897/g.121417 Transcript_51897/m.121417 type:complete len:241 (-) Transcript_51897:658-1380(-)
MVFFRSTFSCRLRSSICLAKSSSSCVKAPSASSSSVAPVFSSEARKLAIALSKSASVEPAATAAPAAPACACSAGMAAPLDALARLDRATKTPCLSASSCAFCASRSCFSRCLCNFMRHFSSSVRSLLPSTFKSAHRSRISCVVNGSLAMTSPPGASRFILCDFTSIFAGSSELMKSWTGMTLKSSPSSYPCLCLLPDCLRKSFSRAPWPRPSPTVPSAFTGVGDSIKTHFTSKNRGSIL